MLRSRRNRRTAGRALGGFGIAVAALGLLAQAAPGEAQEAADDWLDKAAAIEAVIIDKTHLRQRADGAPEAEYHSADGRVAYRYDGCLWAGEWWLQGGGICYRYPSLTGDEEHCFRLKEGDEGLEFWPDRFLQAPQPLAVVVEILDGPTRGLRLGVDGTCREI